MTFYNETEIIIIFIFPNMEMSSMHFIKDGGRGGQRKADIIGVRKEQLA